MRVSDNTARGAVNESIRRVKGKMEGLQLQNATQKRLVNISDDPVANNKIMDIRTQSTVNTQFDANASLAKNRLVMTDVALSEVYDIFSRAKEIAINQSSEASANADSRLGVAQEVSQLYKQLVSIANRRVGQQYLFGGYKSLNAPFTSDGKYLGDNGETKVEIQKDVFIGANLPGNNVFEVKIFKPEDKFRNPLVAEPAADGGAAPGRSPAADSLKGNPSQILNMFHELDSFRVGLLTNDTNTIRDSLDKFDELINHSITLRTKVSSRVAGIDAALGQTAKMDQVNAELASQLEDADYTQLWSDLAKEETVLRSSLQASQKLIQPSLLDFLK